MTILVSCRGCEKWIPRLCFIGGGGDLLFSLGSCITNTAGSVSLRSRSSSCCFARELIPYMLCDAMVNCVSVLLFMISHWLVLV